jgi:hypothetical protein
MGWSRNEIADRVVAKEQQGCTFEDIKDLQPAGLDG